MMQFLGGAALLPIGGARTRLVAIPLLGFYSFAAYTQFVTRGARKSAFSILYLSLLRSDRMQSEALLCADNPTSEAIYCTFCGTLVHPSDDFVCAVCLGQGRILRRSYLLLQARRAGVLVSFLSQQLC